MWRLSNKEKSNSREVHREPLNPSPPCQSAAPAPALLHKELIKAEAADLSAFGSVFVSGTPTHLCLKSAAPGQEDGWVGATWSPHRGGPVDVSGRDPLCASDPHHF